VLDFCVCHFLRSNRCHNNNNTNAIIKKGRERTWCYIYTGGISVCRPAIRTPGERSNSSSTPVESLTTRAASPSHLFSFLLSSFYLSSFFSSLNILLFRVNNCLLLKRRAANVLSAAPCFSLSVFSREASQLCRTNGSQLLARLMNG